MNKDALLRMPELTRRLGIARSTVYKLMQQEGFPRPIRLTRRAVAWDPNDVDEFLKKRKHL